MLEKNIKTEKIEFEEKKEEPRGNVRVSPTLSKKKAVKYLSINNVQSNFTSKFKETKQKYNQNTSQKPRFIVISDK